MYGIPNTPEVREISFFLMIFRRFLPVELIHKCNKLKVKLVLEQATKAQRWSRCIALLFL